MLKRGGSLLLGRFKVGNKGTRTPNICLAKAALYQLSYIPYIIMGYTGFEPVTSPLSGVRSNQLS